MDSLTIKSDRLYRKLQDLEFEIFSCRSKLDKARISKNYYRFLVNQHRINLNELSKDYVTVNMHEYAKIKTEYKHAIFKLEQAEMEHGAYSSFLEKALPKYIEMKEKYDDIIKTLNNQKVILLFKRKK
jgi:hypothetical protein